jgi:endonuclease/exonuclease/phosphatase family metal-dependent hydrolase
VGGFNAPLSSIDRSSRQNINKETTELNDIVDKMNLRDVYRMFHPTATSIHSSKQLREFSKTDHILGHKTSLNKYKKCEITTHILSDHSGIKLEIL